MTSNTTTPAPSSKKLTKVDRLKAELEVAKAKLAADEPALVAALRTAEAELKALRKAYDDADKVSRAAYDALKAARGAEAVRLGLVTKTGDFFSKELMASLKTFAEASGCPDADLVTLARTVLDRDVSKVPKIVELAATLKTADAAKGRAHRAWNVASCPAGKVYSLTHKLEALRGRVSELEAEIAKVPSRNQQARERREDERQEAAGIEQTERARALLPTFSFDGPVQS